MEPQELLPPHSLETSLYVSSKHAQVVEQFEAAKGRLMQIIALKDKTPTAVSPCTESRAKALLRQWEGTLPPVDCSIASQWADEIHTRPDEAEKEALAFFENQEWPAIHNRLVMENGPVTTLKFPKNPMATQAPMVRLIQILAALTETKALDIYYSIRTCSEGRHSYVVHDHFFPYEIDNQPIDMLRIQRDLSGLSSAPHICRPDVGAIRHAIFQAADKYFETYVWSEALQTCVQCKWG